MKMVLLGVPGAGKGTQAKILSKKLGIPTISTGDILRAAISEKTPIGLKAMDYMDAGRLVPDDIVIDIMKQRLAEGDCGNGYILDGMPRTIVQARALEDANIDVDIALSIEISDAEIEERMTGRRTCDHCGAIFHILTRPSKEEGICDVCGARLSIRKDDSPETVKKRLKVYHHETEPLLAFYETRGKLKTVDNQPTIEATTVVICQALGI